ncbi:hypothetical protein [Ornithinibacillus xuwenensis]|uniref:Apea-like HEPN domain-containing protein n=1 Tax=Ornithinibacillus xuwenensis TaxID=3144668 RepID=A0ABU9XH62_9BACI
MERIKFYSEYDMESGININKIIDFINNYQNKDIPELDNINGVLEYFNMIKFFEVEKFNRIIETNTKERINEVKNTLNKKIGKFIGAHKSNGFLHFYAEVDINYKKDFWELVDKYSIYMNIDSAEFKHFLNNSDFHYSAILQFKKTVNYFDEILREHILQDNKGAEQLLRKYIYNENEKEVFLPHSLTEEDKEKILINYIESELPETNYLEMIVNFPSNSQLKIRDRIKLLAKRRYSEEIEKILSGSNSIKYKTGVSVKYPADQKESVIYKENGRVFECSVSRKWIVNNLDYNTLWNNFIHIFDFFDDQMRLNLVSKPNEIGVFERIITSNFDHLYKDTSAFKRKDMMSTLQTNSYMHLLSSYQIRFEDMIEWFFNKYLLEEFGINNYIVKMPTNASSDFEKCRAILPEIESILKQFNLYLEDGEIDQELLQISSSHLFFKDCKSSVQKKYVYPVEGKIDQASFLLFSDQSGIFYLPNLGEKYKNFYHLLRSEKIKLNDFKEFQIKRIEWLIENEFLYIDKNGFIKILNHTRIILFCDLYYNEVISYWNCHPVLRKEIDILIDEKILEIDNSLFTKGEQDYLDYHLNKTKFSNSLDLRNSYLHGTQTTDDELHKMNYLLFLKLIVIIIVKINDDLCIKAIRES